MKKYLTIVLVALLLMVYVPVTSADNLGFYSVLINSGTNVAAGKMYTAAKSVNSDEYDLTGAYSFSDVGAYVTFNIEIPEDGSYDIYAYYGSTASNTITVSSGETVISETTISGNGEHFYVLKRHIASTAFTKGTHSITLTNVLGSGILFGIGVESVLSDEVYAGKSESTAVFGDVVTMIRSGWISYKINPAESGTYLLKLSAKSNANSFINISANNEAVSNIEMIESTDYVDNYVYLDLLAGAQNLMLYDANGKITINAFDLVKISGTKADEKALLDAINQSTEAEDVHTALSTYGNALGINIEELTKDIFYKDVVYNALIDRDFDSVCKILNTLSEKISKEKATPTVLLKSNGGKIDGLQSGNLTFEIDNAQAKLGSSVLVGIYKNTDTAQKLVAVSGTTSLGEDKVIANFNNLEIDNPQNYTWKIFNFENKETIKPYNAYDNIYKEFYVSKSGSDSADGSKNSPFLTLNKAKQAAAEISENMTGDIIINIAGGEYFLPETENFAPENSGKNGYNIVYRGNGTQSNPTVISGGKQVTGWTKGEDGIWKAPLTGVTDVRNLYIDGIAAERARSAYAYIYLEDYDDETTESTVDGFVTSTGQFPEFEHPEDLETVWEISWEVQRAPVEAIKTVDGKKVITFANGDYWKIGRGVGAGSKAIEAGRRFYLENAKELLDTEGEFFYDKREGGGTIYYYPYEEENMQTVKTYVPLTEKLIDISGESKTNKVKNLVFDNIKFKYGADNQVSTNGLMGQQTESYCDYTTKATGTFIFPGQFSMNMADNVKIKNCEFSSLGSVAVTMREGVSDVLFEGNIIKDTSGAALSIGTWKHADSTITSSQETCRNITIKNNVLRRISTEYRQEAAINVYCENGVTIENNDIRHTPYSGISAGWGWSTSNSIFMRNLDISNNKIVNAMENLLDGASIYTLGPIYEGRISGNYTADNRLRNMVGIYLDAGSANLNVHDNLIFANEIYCMRFQTGCYITNNKIYRNYSNTSKPSHNATAINTPEWPNEYEDAIIVDRNNLPAAAQSIYNGAGLEDEYTHLLANVETPAYIRNYNKTKPKREYIDCVGGVIEFEDYTTSANSIHYGYCLGMSSNAEATYEIDVPQAGTYNLHLQEVLTFKDTPVTINVNEGMKYNLTIPYDSSAKDKLYTETVLVYLEAGKNTFTISTPVGSAHFDYMYFKTTDKTIDTITVEAEQFDSYYRPSGSLSSVGTYVPFHPNCWFEYNVYSLEAATYNLSVVTGTPNSYGYVTVDVNDTTSVLTSGYLPNTGNYNLYEETVVGKVSLNKGFNRIRINLKNRSTANGLHFDKFVLTK